MTPTADSGRIGTIVGGTYRIQRHIGSGASSHVFEGEHVRLGKLFAIKLLRRELDPRQRAAQRFRREARAVAKLASEHIVSVVDCGKLQDDTPYLVMERLQGEDLRSLLHREGCLPLPRALHLLLDACRGVAVAHDADVVHRDLKPENLFVTKHSSGEDWCKVLDFGVAKLDDSLETMEGALVGTVRYMSPEQLTTGAVVGPASDVYALGAVLFECLAGEPYARGETPHEIMFSILSGPPRSLRALRADLPGAIVQVVDDCLAREPARRPSSAGELERRLRRVASAPSCGDETVPEANELRVPFRSRNRNWPALLTMAALFGVMLLAADRSPSRSGAASLVTASIAPSSSSTAVSAPTRFVAPKELATYAAPTLPERDADKPAMPVRTRLIHSSGAPGGSPARALDSFDATNPYE